MRKNKIVLTDYAWPDLDLEYEIFSAMGAEFVAAHCESERDVLDLAIDADAVIAEYAPITASVIEKLERCKIISLNAVGYDNVDVHAASEKGILVVNCPDYCFEEVADHTFALILGLARGVVRFGRQINMKCWDFKSAGRLHRLRDSVLGLLGFGKVARAVGRRAKAFGMRVIAFDPYVEDAVFQQEGVERVQLGKLLEESNFLSVHLPRTEQTVNMLSYEQFDAMKISAYVINTSRGGIIDEMALLSALRQGKIAGAALDVMEREPPSFENALFSCEDIILTPHAAFYSEEAMVEVRKRAAQAVVQVLCDEIWPDSVINRELLRTRNQS